MKHMTTVLLATWAGMAFLQAQTVTTITTSASKIDDDIIFDAAGNLYGSNYNGSSVYKRTPDGVESIFTSGLSSPNGMAFNDDETLILADNTGNKLYKVFPDGSKEIFVNSLAGPSGILRMHGSDTLLVTSYTTHKIWKVAPDGSMIVYLTHPQFNGPVGMCYDDSLNLYVANFNDRKVFKVTPDGQITLFTQPPLGQYIGFLAYANGFIYATAMNAHKIYKIDMNGNYIVWLGSTAGSTDGDAAVAKFSQPNGIRASPTGDTLYVSDFGTKRVRMITNLDGTTATGELMPEWNVSVAPNPVKNDALVSFDLPGAAVLSLGLYNEEGRLVRQLVRGERLEQGRHQYVLAGSGLPAGVYFLHFQAIDTNQFFVRKVVVTD